MPHKCTCTHTHTYTNNYCDVHSKVELFDHSDFIFMFLLNIHVNFIFQNDAGNFGFHKLIIFHFLQ